MAEEDLPTGGGADTDAHIRTFPIADVRGYTVFTQERGDEAAAVLAGKFAEVAREILEPGRSRQRARIGEHRVSTKRPSPCRSTIPHT